MNLEQLKRALLKQGYVYQGTKGSGYLDGEAYFVFEKDGSLYAVHYTADKRFEDAMGGAQYSVDELKPF